MQTKTLVWCSLDLADRIINRITQRNQTVTRRTRWDADQIVTRIQFKYI